MHLTNAGDVSHQIVGVRKTLRDSGRIAKLANTAKLYVFEG